MDSSEKDFYRVFEVFSRKTDTSPMQYQFSLLAPNEELALVLAQENFMRREHVSDIWIIPKDTIRVLTEDERKTLLRLDNKEYRTTKGYGYLRRKWRQYNQRMLDDKEILSWAKGAKKIER